MKPRILDLFCGAGGATRGYQEVGFYVAGVDHDPMPNYCGDEFVQMDALEFLRRLLAGERIAGYVLADFAVVHASPPCQAYSGTQRIQAREHPDLIGPTRELLQQTGLPYVIENVPGAPLINPVVLEGQMFDGLGTVRPRLFETNWPLDVPFLRPPRPRQAKMGRRPKAGEWIQVVGNFADAEAGRRAMGIDWMTRDELAQAIPPAYTALIGEQLIQRITASERVA